MASGEANRGGRPPVNKSEFLRELTESGDAAVTVDLNVEQVKRVNHLLRTGLWGNTPRQTVARLVDCALREEMRRDGEEALKEALRGRPA